MSSVSSGANTRPIFRNPIWQPTKWHPVYERVVALSAAGMTNIQIGEALGYTKQHISNILRTQEAKRVLERIYKNMRAQNIAEMSDDLDEITRCAIKNVKHVLVDQRDSMLLESPFKMLDRSMTFLKGIGKLQGDTNNTTIQNNTLILSSAHQKQVVAGLDKLREVWSKHGGPNDDVAQVLEDATEDPKQLKP